MKKIFLYCFYLIAVNNLFAQNKLMQEPKTKLNYLLHEPIQKTDKTPLLILLHGYGSNENDLISFTKQLPQNMLVVSLRAPIKLSENSYAWYSLIINNGNHIYSEEEAEHSRMLLITFINQLKLEQNFDASQIYMCGFSQGAIMSYSVALTTPNMIKGFAALSGRILDETKKVAAKNASIKKLQIFISHGTNDEIINVGKAREADTFLKSIGIAPAYHEYEAPHTINTQMFVDFVTWLKKAMQ